MRHDAVNVNADDEVCAKEFEPRQWLTRCILRSSRDSTIRSDFN